MQAQATILWGFLDTSTKFIYTLSIWIGIILRTLIFAINIFKNRRFIYPSMHIFRVSQIETMYSRDNVFLENRHSLENVYNVFSENTPLKKCPYPIFLDGRGTARGGQQPCSSLGWGTARGRLGAAIIGRFSFDSPARPRFWHYLAQQSSDFAWTVCKNSAAVIFKIHFWDLAASRYFRF